jgi:exoribonuclease R
MNYEVEIMDRHYAEWVWRNADTKEIVECELNPLDLRLFSGDVVQQNGELIYSNYMSNATIPGILVIDGKTYGRSKNKLIYKCIPDNPKLPSFLMPYEQRNNSFNKKKTNKYVVFRIKEWIDKHPTGIIMNTIGDVDVLDNFYEYQLYCRNLNNSIQRFNKSVSNALKKSYSKHPVDEIMEMNKCIEDRTACNVFSIDPNGCQDFDDAISLIETAQGHVVSVYIADVMVWLEHLDLWKHFTERVSTIYFPDKKRPMLPSILSDKLCSLQEGQRRFAFAMDIHVVDNEVSKVEYSKTVIRVKKNYEYEEPLLLKDNNYRLLLDLTRKLCKNLKYLDSLGDSHDVVAFYMIMMNHQVSKTMITYGNGIYRSAQEGQEEKIPTALSQDVKQFMKIWKCSAGQYSCFEERKSHQLIASGLDSYLHITSPIRRLVDLLNMIVLQHNLKLNQSEPSESAMEFYNGWTERLSFINSTMRSVRKVQSDCSLLHMYVSGTLCSSYSGCVFEKTSRHDDKFSYMVYIPELKIVSRVNTVEDIENYSMKQFTTHLFMDEAKLKKKIRLQIIDS